MEGNKMIIAMSFALILISFFWIQGVYVIAPILQGGIYATEKGISVQIDALSSVDEGRVKLNIPVNMIKSVSVSYETKGDKESYKISEDGWYVIVSYKLGTGSVKGVSLIRSYPKGAAMEKTILSPSDLCVVKRADSPYAEVARC
ncbi:MAG: hypothetical protein V1813_03600 [Candidatus Aenigmatarchaeota archaeon]